MKPINKQEPAIILGEEIDPDNMPILYRWANNNPETLKRLLKSLSERLHGSVRAAMLSLESDLQHG